MSYLQNKKRYCVVAIKCIDCLEIVPSKSDRKLRCTTCNRIRLNEMMRGYKLKPLTKEQIDRYKKMKDITVAVTCTECNELIIIKFRKSGKYPQYCNECYDRLVRDRHLVLNKWTPTSYERKALNINFKRKADNFKSKPALFSILKKRGVQLNDNGTVKRVKDG